MNQTRNHSHSRGAASGLVIGVIVVAVLALGGLYFFSDVFRTKADRTMKNLLDWTPENIAADPGGYLDFCEKKANDAMKSLKASKIAVMQNMESLKSKHSEAASTIGTGDKALGELKDLYAAAEKDDKWPVKWQTKEFDQAAAKKQIVALHSSIAGKKKLLDTLNTGVKKLELQQTQIKDAEYKCEEQLTKIATSREMLKVQAITDDIKKQLVDMKGVLVGVVDTADDKTSLVSLENLAAESALNVDDKEFDKIMKGN